RPPPACAPSWPCRRARTGPRCRTRSIRCRTRPPSASASKLASSPCVAPPLRCVGKGGRATSHPAPLARQQAGLHGRFIPAAPRLLLLMVSQVAAVKLVSLPSVNVALPVLPLGVFFLIVTTMVTESILPFV